MSAPSADSLLGVVFAGADMVFEIDAAGLVNFALGAVESLSGIDAAALRGRSWNTLFATEDQDLLPALLAGLGPGERLGPLRVTLAAPRAGRTRPASLSVFRLPRKTGDPVSCALSIGAQGAAGEQTAPDGLLTQDDFAAAAAGLIAEAQREGLSIRLDLVELDGFEAASADLGQDAAAVMRRQLAAALRADSYGGLGASEVAADKFAVLRDASASPQRLSERLKTIVGDRVQPVVAALPLSAESESQNLRALRYALDRYIEDGAQAAEKGFAAVVKRTVSETARFRSVLAAESFQLAYQPVVTLKSSALHHYEALARFDSGGSPADTIRMAEELNLIVDFDLAVVRMVAKALIYGPGDLKIAANLSAVSLMQPGFAEAVIKVTTSAPNLPSRFLLEVTETHALQDLGMANRVLQDLRGRGHAVCMDDFGAGAASLEYLRCLDVDFVKIDGRYIQSLTAGSRDEMILKHVVALCRDMRVETIAEMMETAESARLAEALGVTFGQGWRFGKPTLTPSYVVPPSPSALKRAGGGDQWS